jgi:hypothetical protein
MLQGFKQNVFTLTYTNLNLLLKQVTFVGVTELEKCDSPPSKLTADVMLSSVADPSSVGDPNNVIVYLTPFRLHITIY